MSSAAVITGGAGGIGRAVARRLLDSTDLAVALVDRAGSAADDLTADPRCRLYECDVTDQASVNATAERVARESGPITRLVNGAGTVNNAASADVGIDVIEGLFATHVNGTVLWSQAAYPQMVHEGAGSIVNIGSIAGRFGHPRRLAYGAAKAAIHSISKTLAVEWAAVGIRVNAIVPGYVATPMMLEVARLGLVDEAQAASWHALKRLATPDEIAAPIVFLLSDDASFITGSGLLVDGGFSALKAEQQDPR